ncbi:PepSY domain-containing protein [Pontibacter diazotrophicus]|uniref:PepSY domain-containing protein n=1 Tax=Pontibacter diazotrophicus TaxID=1400979 RepID=A0A3D8L3A1_9BACT|nr:PepSY-associated TM helix domain-containing protein [Pontibacter diazotrophicus]RDV11462.1 PepSY domain-containing protein [Pontibacter diazotrophicus]
MRKFILQVHLWVGLVAGAVLSVVGITGSVYVFQPELTVVLYPHLYKATPAAKAVEVREVLHQAEEQFGSEVVTINFPLRELENYILKVKRKKEWLFYDAGTGSYLGEMELRRGLLDEVLEVHRTLTVGEKGSVITGTCALLLAFVLVSSGVMLWWPRKKRRLKDGLRLKPDVSFKRRTYDLHNVFGFYFSIPLAIVAITGVYFAFPNQTQETVNTITRTAEPMPDPKQLKSVYRSDVPSMTIYQALDLMDSKYGDYYKRYLILPKDSVGYVYLSYTYQAAISAGAQYRPTVYLDQYTADVLYEYDPTAAPLGHRVTRNWFIPLHFGEVGGYLTRGLWFLLGLMPGMLWVTGIIIWRGKARKGKYVRSVRNKVVS